LETNHKTTSLREYYATAALGSCTRSRLFRLFGGAWAPLEEGFGEGRDEMARNLLSNGVPPDVIAKSAGLPLERIQALFG
jgi:hypothetical protein